MKLEDLKTSSSLRAVGLGLTTSEAKELRDSLDDLLAHGDPQRHHHVASSDFQIELTLWIEDGA